MQYVDRVIGTKIGFPYELPRRSDLGLGERPVADAVREGRGRARQWSPAGNARTVIAVGLPAPVLDRYFASVVPAGRLHAVEPLEDDLPISICRGRRLP
jgi:hypothetical protein